MLETHFLTWRIDISNVFIRVLLPPISRDIPMLRVKPDAIITTARLRMLMGLVAESILLALGQARVTFALAGPATAKPKGAEIVLQVFVGVFENSTVVAGGWVAGLGVVGFDAADVVEDIDCVDYRASFVSISPSCVNKLL